VLQFLLLQSLTYITSQAGTHPTDVSGSLLPLFVSPSPL